jgi:hypothetical protein
VRHPGPEFTRWPTLLAAVTLATSGVALDLASHAPVAFALWALSAACFGAFLYAEGARHRDWTDAERRYLDADADTPDRGAD